MLPSCKSRQTSSSLMNTGTLGDVTTSPQVMLKIHNLFGHSTCTGVIVAERPILILSAAHCFVKFSSTSLRVESVQDVSVLIGEFEYRPETITPNDQYTMKRIYSLPGESKKRTKIIRNWLYDLAFLQLDPNVELPSGKPIAKLATTRVKPGQKIKVSGFGVGNSDPDRDGIRAGLDICDNTPTGSKINVHGCHQNMWPLFTSDLSHPVEVWEKLEKSGDYDGDGVLHDEDDCEWTPRGLLTDTKGCAEGQLNKTQMAEFHDANQSDVFRIGFNTVSQVDSDHGMFIHSTDFKASASENQVLPLAGDSGGAAFNLANEVVGIVSQGWFDVKKDAPVARYSELICNKFNREFVTKHIPFRPDLTECQK